MLRNNGLRRRRRNREDLNPMDNVSNLVDIMMVFACGLMVSIILRWDIDLGKVKVIIDQSQLVEVDSTDILNEDGNVSGEYESMGTVIEDPNTGKMYIIKK